MLCLLWSTAFSQHVYPQSTGGSSFNVISPPQITAAADDWNPSGLSTASAVRLSGDNQFRIISGISSSGTARTLTLTNIGTFAVLLAKEHPSSTATNRFNIAFDLPIYPGQSITLVYDITSTRWKLTSEFPTNIEVGKQVGASIAHTGSVASADYDAFIFTTGSGILTTTAPTATTPRRIVMSSGASATSTPSVSGKNLTAFLNITAPMSDYTFSSLEVSTLSDATDRYTFLSGMSSSSTSSTASGAYFKYSDNINGGNWQCVTRNGASETAFDSGVTVNTGTKYDLLVLYRPDASVAFFINDVYVGQSTTNIFSGSVYNIDLLVKSAGTNAKTVVINSLNFMESRR